MPRKKQGPKKLDEDAQKAANFVMGEEENGDTENNLEINRELTNQLREAPAADVDDIVQAASGSNTNEERSYNVIFDDDEEEDIEYISSEDEDFDPVKAESKGKKASKKSPSKKSKSSLFPISYNFKKNFHLDAEGNEIVLEPELKSLLEDAQVR